MLGGSIQYLYRRATVPVLAGRRRVLATQVMPRTINAGLNLEPGDTT